MNKFLQGLQHEISKHGTTEVKFVNKSIMKTRQDIIRQASIFTSSGLIDPRVMPGYAASKVNSRLKFGNKVRRFIENLFHKFEKRQASM